MLRRDLKRLDLRSEVGGLEIGQAEPISAARAPASLIPLDDLAAPFQIENQPVRGRLVRLGPAIDEILTRHDYPAPVANLLGETCALAALVGSSLKFEGRLIVQAQGDGPVSYVVADYDTEGSAARLLPLRRRRGWRRCRPTATFGRWEPRRCWATASSS